MRKLLLLIGLASLLGCGPNPAPDPDPLAPPIFTPIANDPAAPSGEVARLWGQLTLRTLHQLPGNSPTYASRSLGYAGLTMYECVVAGSPSRRSLAGQLNGLTALPKPEPGLPYDVVLALNAGQATILKALFGFGEPFRVARIDSLEKAIYAQASKTVDVAVATRSVAYGRAVAKTISDWAQTDGGHQGYLRNFDLSYRVPVGAGKWVAPVAGQVVSTSPLHPYWGKNRPFAATNGDLPVPDMVPFSALPASTYASYCRAVYEKSKSLTAEDKAIAAWWADDPTETFSPPGHSYSLAGIVSRTANTDLYGTAETYARVGMAVADAFINCWKAKYTYHCERPSTYVRNWIDKNWQQFWPEPPFPAFYSGHSVQSAATATVLESLYGSAFRFVDDSHKGRRSDFRAGDYVPRTYASFWASAEEAALSRFYGGIHTEQDNAVGLTEGRKIGRNINALTWRK